MAYNPMEYEDENSDEFPDLTLDDLDADYAEGGVFYDKNLDDWCDLCGPELEGGWDMPF